MADFIFRLESVELTNDEKRQLATAIQGAVLTELAKLDLSSRAAGTEAAPRAPGGSTFAYYPHHGWYGGFLGGDLEALEAAANTVYSVQEEQTEQAAAAGAK